MRGRGRAYRFLALLAVVALLGGCSYRFSVDQTKRLAPGQTVWVSYFKNSTVFANAPVMLKRAIFDQFAAQRGIMAAASPEAGDLWLEGTITGYSATVVSYSSADTAKEYRLTVHADIIVRRKGDTKDSVPFWKGSVSAWQDYPVSSAIELQRNSEDAALAAAARKLAQQLIWQIEQDY